MPDDEVRPPPSTRTTDAAAWFTSADACCDSSLQLTSVMPCAPSSRARRDLENVGDAAPRHIVRAVRPDPVRTARRLQRDEATTRGDRDGLAPALRAELREDGFDVKLGGAVG